MDFSCLDRYNRVRKEKEFEKRFKFNSFQTRKVFKMKSIRELTVEEITNFVEGSFEKELSKGEFDDLSQQFLEYVGKTNTTEYSLDDFIYELFGNYELYYNLVNEIIHSKN